MGDFNAHLPQYPPNALNVPGRYLSDLMDRNGLICKDPNTPTHFTRRNGR